MTRALSSAARHAVYSQQTSEAFIVLLTITHPGLTDDIRLASDPKEILPEANVRGVMSRGQEYIFMPFSMNLPSQNDTGTSRATISIDNIDRRMVEAVRTATGALNITIEIVLSSDTDTVEVSVPDFKMDRITYDALTISGDISVEYFDLEPYPSKRFTPSDFPGLF